MATDTQVFNDTDLTLVVSPTRGGNTANVKVAWCLSKNLSEYLQQREAREPHLLVYVSHGENATPQQFKLVQLSQGMTIIGLRAAGTNTIHATIVWRQAGEAGPVSVIKNLHDVYESYNPGVAELKAKRAEVYRQMDSSAVESDVYKAAQRELAKINKQLENTYDYNDRLTKISETISYVNQVDLQVSVDVNVPEGMFAKQPNRVVKWLADFATDGRKVDECKMRKYAGMGFLKLIAYGVLIPLLWIFAKTTSLLYLLWLLLLGKRNIEYSAIFCWEPENPAELGRYTGRSFWWYNKIKPGDPWASARYELRHPVFLIINPPVLLALGLIALIVFSINAAWVYGAALALAVVGGSIFAVYAWQWHRKKSGPKPEEVNRYRIKLGNDLDNLVCNTPRKSGVVTDEIKPRRMTLTLLFEETKSRVCKPFSM